MGDSPTDSLLPDVVKLNSPETDYIKSLDPPIFDSTIYPPGYTLIPGKHFYRRNPCVHQLLAKPVTRSLGQVVASTSKKL